MYTEKDLAHIAKRENNTKRKYLVVNPKQGKHVPVHPAEALEMFRVLADTVRGAYQKEELLFVGFAETATAIGAALAVELGGAYIQTTREVIAGVDYLFFSEAHSHASEQKLVRNDMDAIIDKIDRIMFVEDEVTTGNTILNIINLIRKNYSKKIAFSVASILNGMDENAVETFREQEISLHYLVKTNHEPYTKIAENYKGDGEYITYHSSVNGKEEAEDSEVIIYKEGYDNARRITDGAHYKSACEALCKALPCLGEEEKILVLGTEEFMYPPLFVASKLEEKGHDVWFHATTRSPIAVDSALDYPLHKRYELRSLYEAERVTYIYELQKYDRVFIITDAEVKKEGLTSLINALKLAGNINITTIVWN